MIKETIKYVENFFNETKEKYPNLNDKILKSCLLYQFLYQKHFNADKSIDEILQLNTGRKNGFTRVTKVQQKCSKYHICRNLLKFAEEQRLILH